MLTCLTVIFWACLALVAYCYAGYPALIWLLARLRGRRPVASAPDENELPFVSVLIAAYNEETEIAGRIENALAMDYPRDRLEIVVGSDGSTDGTSRIVSRYADRGVRLLHHNERRGKASVLNHAFPTLQGQIVLLSDANTHTDPGAARALVRWFADPRVGAVCGRLVLTDPATGRNADSLYWKYETFLKRCEGRLGALLGANGAIYAIRRELFAPIAPETIVDDFVIPLLATLRTGCTIVYDPEAVAHEETPANLGSEFHRRSRIGAGGFQSLGQLWPLLDPRRGWIAFTFISHKVLRWLCPFFLVGLFASGAALAAAGILLYAGLWMAQVGFYVASLVAVSGPGAASAPKLVRVAAMFTLMNAALLVGFVRWVRGSQKATWKRTARLAEAGSALS
jgi:cellulose synthase/poly-beta-1,6-N-acetylglucosamine synthase-like glycosyltransferase